MLSAAMVVIAVIPAPLAIMPAPAFPMMVTLVLTIIIVIVDRLSHPVRYINIMINIAVVNRALRADRPD